MKRTLHVVTEKGTALIDFDDKEHPVEYESIRALVEAKACQHYRDRPGAKWRLELDGEPLRFAVPQPIPVAHIIDAAAIEPIGPALVVWPP